jgi:hypothetical protein
LDKEDGTFIYDKRYDCTLVETKEDTKHILVLKEFGLAKSGEFDLIILKKDMLESIVRMYNAIRRKK